MISYTCVGTNDWDAAKTFYNELMAEAGAKPLFKTDRFQSYGTGMDKPMFAIVKPYNGEAATPGNGNMVTLQCSGKEQVQALHAKAMALGGTCEGEPGPRANDMFYLAYARDLDGNKLAFFCPN